MKRFLYSILAVVFIVSAALGMHYNSKESVLENNVEVLSKDEGHFLFECNVQSSFGGITTIGFVCNQDTTANHVFPCLNYGLVGIQKKECYK